MLRESSDKMPTRDRESLTEFGNELAARIASEASAAA
jgi:hypothetical protein